ncbi:unnamed protein product [Mytilus edulis]|uniref:Tudor domain-containing protein n=1 Tax=Mytilus edulis TaxID=6550 RepID=A0A8S3STT5_MYTED|nr:unnamed protein product [Mytilus edulis]
MSGSERWKIVIENGRLCVEENGRYFEDIDNVGTTRDFGIIKVTYESGKAKMYSLKNLCEGLGFGPAVKTRSGFMKIWDSLKANVDNYQLQTSSTDNIDQSKNQVNMNISDVTGGEDLTRTDDNVNTLDNVQRKSSTRMSPVHTKLLSPMDSSEVVLDKQIDKNEKSSNLLQVEKTKYQTLEEMYNKLEEAKACLEKKVQEFEESIRCQHTEKHTSQVNYSIVSGRDLTPKQKLKNDCSHSDNLNKKKRRMSSKEFEVGTSVEAFWYPDKCWYTAKILMKTGKGYEVKYDLDKFVKDLPLKYVRAEKISTE